MGLAENDGSLSLSAQILGLVSGPNPVINHRIIFTFLWCTLVAMGFYRPNSLLASILSFYVL